MVHKMFSLYDSKAESFGPPVFIQSVGQAERMFADLVNDGKSMPFKHPSDFVLYMIGEFQDMDGSIKSITPHVSLGSALEFVKKSPVAV